MKKSLVLAMAMALGVTASAYAANPFSDVPAGHWAYDSINKLAAAGVVEGYGDATFGGDKLMTRYEMAQIVAKAMAKGANVDKLAAEFADELDNLGVRVANLEKKADNVKITGETKYRYWDYNRANNQKDTSKDALRSRIWVKGAINDDWTYSGMLENIQAFQHSDSGEETTKFQRAYVNGKLGGVKVQAGRYGFTDFTGGNIYDTRMDGVQAAYGKDVKLTVGAGKAADAAFAPTTTKKNDGSVADNMYYASLAGKIGVVDANVSYYKFNEVTALNQDDKVAALSVAFPVVKDLKMSASYLKSNVDKNGAKDIDDDGYVIGLDYKGAKAGVAGSYGIFAKYYDQAAGTFVAHTMEAENFGIDNEGFKGYMVGANYTFAKNIVGAVKYFDLEGKKGDDETNTLYAELNFMF